MDEKRSEFLATMIGILDRLQRTSINHGEPLLAGMLAIAQTEAEDALRHGGALKALAAERAERSSAHTWRACDRPEAQVEPDAAQPKTARIAA
jgi:hypothetical protein